MCVKKRLIPDLFNGVDVHPALSVLTVYFGPDVVFTVPYPTNSAADCTTQHAEAVRPLTNTSSSCLEKDKGITVAREAFVSLALSVGALVDLDTVGTTGLFIRKRSGHANSNSGCVACTALGVVDPLEEVTLEPLHKSSDNTVLVAPGRLGVRSQ
jgi:hypothetical protein